MPTKSDFSLDIAAIQNALSPHTACIIINSPNNPTGKIYSHAEIAALAACLHDFATSRGAHSLDTEPAQNAPLLICDEPYREIVYDGATVPSVFPLYDNAIIVSSFAKDLSLAGERIGYIAVNPKMANQKEVVSALIFANRTLGYVNANAFFQRVIARAGESGASGLLTEKPDFSHYAKCRSLVMQILDKAGIEYAVPQGAFYVFAKSLRREKQDTYKLMPIFVRTSKNIWCYALPEAALERQECSESPTAHRSA
ncbi:MAG: hypothetical protein Ta2A_05720 [Treponemataceae bacterium]|nr:MAG: hypothetical protein Ta2A_05720 [Treponemataceae bacterium]